MSEQTPERDDSLVFDTVESLPFYGPIDKTKSGKWFTMPDDGDPDGAIVWTDGEHLGWLSINNNYAFARQFMEHRYFFHEQGMTADQGFWSTYEVAEDSGMDVPIKRGLLSQMVQEHQQKSGYVPTTGDDMNTPANASFGVTLDEDDNVIELVRTDETGTFVRSAGEWVALDPDNEDDFEGIEDYEWVDVTSDVVDYFDANSQSNDLKRTDIAPFTA